MYRLGLVDTLVTHANMKELGLTSLFGDHRSLMPLQLKTKQNKPSPSTNTQRQEIIPPHCAHRASAWFMGGYGRHTDSIYVYLNVVQYVLIFN